MFNKTLTDKLSHLLVYYVFVLVAWLILGPIIPDWPLVFVILTQFAISVAAAALFSIGKEIYDSKRPGNHSCKCDLQRYFIGAILGCVTGILNLQIS